MAQVSLRERSLLLHRVLYFIVVEVHIPGSGNLHENSTNKLAIHILGKEATINNHRSTKSINIYRHRHRLFEISLVSLRDHQML